MGKIAAVCTADEKKTADDYNVSTPPQSLELNEFACIDRFDVGRIELDVDRFDRIFDG